MNNLSLSPLSSPDLWSQAVTIAESPETKVDQLEREADEQAQHLPEAQRAAYRTMVRREIAHIRTMISEMRVNGANENAINRVIDRLCQHFNESKNRFLEGNESFARNRAQVCGRNQATANKIRSCTVDFSPIKRLPAEGSLCQRPSFSEAVHAYSEVEGLSQLQEVVGGKLKQNFDGEVFINGCASRISYILNQTGTKIPAMHGKTVSGSNGDQYIYRLTDLEKFLRKTFGSPDCEWKNGSVSGKANEEKCRYISKVEWVRKGILIERWKPGPHTTCTGHARLVNGEEWATVHPPSDGVFWELPDDK